ncbi:putative RNA-directed DNA polymerase [Tanacetum coccineum]
MTIRSSILSKETLPDVKVAYAIISSEESHRMASGSMSGPSHRAQTSAFMSNGPARNNFQRNQNTNSNYVRPNSGNLRPNNSITGFRPNNPNMVRPNVPSNADIVCENCGYNVGFTSGSGTTSSSTGFTEEQMATLLSLLKDNTGSEKNIQANMACMVYNSSKIFHDNFDDFFCSNSNMISKMGYVGKIIDSGANQHMTNNENDLENVYDISHLNIKVAHPNGTNAVISKIGNLRLQNGLMLFDVLVIPAYCVTLISVNKLARDNKIFVVFNENMCFFVNQDLNLRNVLGTGKQCGGLYYLDTQGTRCKINQNIFTCSLSAYDWHCRLGHPADPALNVLKGYLKLDKIGTCDFYEICQRAKQTREPFPLSEHKTKLLGDLVHLDLWGPYKVISHTGHRFFLTIVDDYTRAVWVYLIKSKDEVFESIKIFHNLIKNQFKRTVKIFRSDNGTEFVNQNFNKFCNDEGIIHQTSCVYTPQQNGIVERKHRHLLPSSVLNGNSPYHMIYNCPPKLSYFRIFGCLCFATILNNHDKLTSRSEKCVMMGYSSSQKGYRLYSLDRHQFLVSRDVKFFETIFPFKESVSNGNKVSNVFQDNNRLNFFDLDDLELPNDDERVKNKHNSDHESHSNSGHSASLGDNVDTADSPGNGDISHSNDNIDASLHEDEAATLDDNLNSEGNVNSNPSTPPHGIQTLRGNSGSKVNTNAQGTQNLRRSTRSSVFPKNYNDHVVNSKVKYGIEKFVGYSKLIFENLCFVTQLNKNCEPKSFFEASQSPQWVNAMNAEMSALLENDTWDLVKLPSDRKALTSKILSSPRQWNSKLTSVLVENGFCQSKSDYSLYTKSIGNVFLALLVYVDDIIVTGNNSVEIKKFKVYLKGKFKIKDLGKLNYFLGIEVVDTKTGICLNQRKYVLDLLSEYGMLACKPSKTPLVSKLIISNIATENDPSLVNIVDYQKLMGKLIYLTNTRPDISYAVHCLSQFMHSPLTSHVKIAFKILRYLKGSPGLGIYFSKRPGMSLKAYSDADWAKCIVTRKSIIGYCVFMNGDLVSWKSKKQNTLSKSSSEAEYRALASVISEVVWILKILKDLKLQNLLPVELYCDSNPAIKIAANPIFHERTKHLEIDLHFVREIFLNGVVKTMQVDSANQIADILTKGLDTYQHNFLVKKLGLTNPFGISD